MSDKQGAPILPPLAGGGGNNGTSNSGASQQTVSLQQVLASAQGLNVLTMPAGQQFVITSQVPGLTQVISSGTPTNAGGMQQVGFPRIVNIGGGSPRVSVVGVASASGSPLASSPSRQTATKMVLATSPKLVRTSIASMFVTPASQPSPGQSSSPARKKLRLSETAEKITASDDATSTTTTTTTTTTMTTTTGYRRRIMEHKMKRMRAIREKYAENASELFFLHAGGNMMDFQAWKRRPPTPQYLHFLRQHRLDPEDDDEDLTVPLPQINVANDQVAGVNSNVVVPLPGNPIAALPTPPVTQNTEVKITGVGATPVAVSTTLPAAVAQLSQQGGTPIVPEAPKPQPPPTVNCPVVEKSTLTAAATTTTVASTRAAFSTPTTTATNATSVSSPSVSAPQPIVKLVKLPQTPVVTTGNLNASSEAQNNQEQIVEKAKQEAYVMQRIAELQRDGLWSERRLPKVQEPARTKAHWDYLLEEMVWLAADFAQERKWKKAAAKKCARMVQKHFQEKAIQAQKAEKSQELRLKKIAGFAAKEIKTFWTNVEKLVEFKQQTRLEEKRKKALDQHLNFIVGQTEKYSTWLTEGLNKTEGAQSVPASINSSRISSPVPPNKHQQHSDDEFEPNQSSEDDEETIARAEEEMKSTTNHKEEVELLKKESEIPLEDLIKELPPNYLEERDKSLSPGMKETVEDENDATADGDTEFTVASEESSDDENTIMEQEKAEGNTNHQKELDDLKAENEMSIDELMAKYGNAQAMPMDVDGDGDTDNESGGDSGKDDDDRHDEKSESESESEDETKVEEEDSQTQSDDETGVGLKSLLEDLSAEKPEDNENTASGEQHENHNEMDDVAALAESIQPKGNTLLTTSVVTKIPFLLKHSLREYQHIGLDWLVTMYDRKLNGILADEMGLGKTIQTIALLAHLACEKGNWGPHLIIVPTSVMLNWEMECKKWCPGFKILTYYGTQKERKQKRTGWTKPNAFHICITSYKLVIQDHQSFRRKKWKYLILDEAQNIKNFKSQRWQLLLNFQTQRRLLLTGTPLQNNLMELWSLMHFLMPNVFQSHREFKEWFSNPVTGMIEGNSEYNENIIRRLHKVLRPFLLRRLKTEVEKQLPKKYEHVVMCRLSKRQRYLYDDFMSRAKTRETLASGNLLSVINVLMQLRKVCNHPNLFEVRPTVSPFQMEAIEFVTASLAWSALDYDPFKCVDLSCLNLLLVNLEFTLTAFVAHRVKRLQTPRKLIEEIDSLPDPPPRCPAGKIKINVRLSNQAKAPVAPPPPVQPKMKNLTGIVQNPRVGTSPLIKTLNNQTTPGQGVTLRVAGGQQLQGYSVQLVQHQGSVKAIPVGTLAHNPSGTASVTTTSTAGMNAPRITMGNANIRDGLQRLTAQTVTVKQGDSVQRIAVPSFAQLVQTSTGRHIILTSNQQNTNTVSFPVMTSCGPRLTVLSKSLMGLSTANKVVGSVVTTTTNSGGRVGMRVPPLNVNASPGQAAAALQQQSQLLQAQQQQTQQQQPLRCGIVTRNAQKETQVKVQPKEQPKSEFYLTQLEEGRRQRRQSKLRTIAKINERRCAACPLYGEDLFTALRIGKPASGCQWHNGHLNCATAKDSPRTRRQFFSRTEALAAAIKSTEQIVEELKEVFQRFVVYVPAVRAPMPRFHVSHPPPHKFWAQQRLRLELGEQVAPKLSVLHPVAGAMMTQFPDPRLIQYDCGKLQSLDRLLRTLKTGSHRVLIFTQMTRMLDVLEAFLNFHGHIYLRLDGATRVDQRQVLMERFNGDKRIFCFILSTRSGGVGVNLTGADTVIFYDSDWNPTMDAQAQDRCHRIGQTRDVHIYRLVSEKTVEENILKKANQKRLLGDLAIEGGNFTTAYFKSSTIQDLFNVDQSENDASARMADVLEQSKDRERALHRDLAASTASVAPSSQPTEEKAAMGALESALAAAEEDLDVQAARTAKAEAVADLAEFDENIPLDEAEKEDAQVSKAEQEVQNLVSQLTPVERYAMKFVEESEGTFSAAQLAAAERELEQQKKEWELDRLRALREEEERRLRLADDDEKPLTFGREDAQNQVNNTSNSKRVAVSKKRGQDNSAMTSSSSSSSSSPPSSSARRSSLRRASRGTRDESITESETETTTDSEESESQDDDLVEDSPDEESSHTESQSQGDEEDDDGEDGEDGDENDENDENDDDEDNDDDDDDEDENYEDEDEEMREARSENERGGSVARGGALSKRRSRPNKTTSERNNRWDLNSPRTRSRGDVKINLWTLDVSPILPGVKPNFRNRRVSGGPRGRNKSARKRSEDGFLLPQSPLASPRKNQLGEKSHEKSRRSTHDVVKSREPATGNAEATEAAAVAVSGRRKNNSNGEKLAENASQTNDEVENSESKGKMSIVESDEASACRAESPAASVDVANVEVLIDEKMSEISCNMETSQSDESDERASAFSPETKPAAEQQQLPPPPPSYSSIIAPEAPRLEIILSDIAAKMPGDRKFHSEKTAAVRATRSKPASVKRLTQTFDASFDETGVSSNFETESVTLAGSAKATSTPVHVTRSTHKSSTQFNNSSTNADNGEEPEKSEKIASATVAEISKTDDDDDDDDDNGDDDDDAESTESSNKLRINRRANATSITPDPEKLTSVDVDAIVPVSQRKRSIATRSRIKLQLEDSGAKIVDSTVEKIIVAEATRSEENEVEEPFSQPPIARSIRDEILKDFMDGEDSSTEESSKADESCKNENSNHETAAQETKDSPNVKKDSHVFASPVSAAPTPPKPMTELRVRLRRPDTPLPGVLTRRAKSTVPEASSSSSSSSSYSENEAKLVVTIQRQVRKSLDGRRSTRLSGISAEAQESETMLQSVGKKIVVVKRSDSPVSGDLSRKAKTPPALPVSNNSAKSLPKKSETQPTDDQPENSSNRPKTRSSLISNPPAESVVKMAPPASAAERPTTRSTRPSLDNSFIPPQALCLRKSKSSGGETSNSAVRLTRRASSEVSPQKRPDTPLPTMVETSARVTRSGIGLNALNAMIPRIRSLRKASVTGEESQVAVKRETPDTDTNGNAVVPESHAKDLDDNSPADGNEKPQRTAKVVAILSLDSSLSRGKATSATSATRKGGDDNEAKISVVDVDSESENESAADSNNRRTIARRNVKRARFSSLTKPLLDGKDECEIQIVEIVDEEEMHTQPTRKMVKMQSSERLNNSSAS